MQAVTFLFHFLRYGTPPEKILYLAENARFDRPYTPEELRRWLKVFLQRFFANQFKRSCLPDGPKVAQVAQLSISCVRSARTHSMWVMGFQNSVKNRRNAMTRRGLQSFHYKKPRFSAGIRRFLPIFRQIVRNLG